MNKYENALVEILNGLGNYNLHTIFYDDEPRYLLSIPADFDEDIEIRLSEETYNTLIQLDKDINGKE
jgi:hypothetical protein